MATKVQRSALVEHGPRQMFDLVADVERYPEFLAWVVDAVLHERGDSGQRATLTVSVAGVTRKITTVNRLVPGRELELKLEQGPFNRFAGLWSFMPAGSGCRISLELEFTFDSPVLAAAFRRGFTRVADRMVDDFCRRADALYA